MSTPPALITPFGYAWRIAVIALAYAAATMFSGAVVGAAKVPMPVLPQGAGQQQSIMLLLLGALCVAACLAPLARGLAGTTAGRWLALAPFTYVCTGFNNAIEAAFFTTLGGTPAMMLMSLAPCLLAAWLAVALVPGADAETPSRALYGWWWRALLVWLAFPAIYYLFGMLAYPWVRELYEQPGMGLTVPTMPVVVRVVLLRSLLFLAVLVLVIVRWSRSRRSLTATLAAAMFVMVGLFGLLQTTWWPVGMRVVHSLEIFADSLVYAWVAVALLAPRTGEAAPPA
jgi:hypothetical protein